MERQAEQLALDAINKGIYAKNIHYFYSKTADPDEFAFAKAMGGSPAQSAWMIQQAYNKLGVQIQVGKEVTDELLATDFGASARVENVPWPGPVVEIYFEDPKLPTILLMKATPEQIEGWFPHLTVGLKSEEYITGLMQEGTDELEAKQLSVQLKPSMYDQFLLRGEAEAMETSFFSYPLNNMDNCTMAFMLNLSLKVLAFASMKVCKSIPLTKKQMKWGGKPDVKGRPNRPSTQKTYLPAITYAKPQRDPTGRTIDFKGRLGHIHWYRSEVFVNRKGSWDLIRPIKNPHTGQYPERKSLYKVRKP